MPITAPDVTGAATYKTVSYRFVGSDGELRTVSARVPSDATALDIQALAVAYGALTNANLYEVQVTDRWASLPDAGSATDAVHESVFDNIALNTKDIAAGTQQTVFAPAPIADSILDGDVVDTSLAAYTTWRDAWVTLLAGDYSAISARFTERRDKNDSVPA